MRVAIYARVSTRDKSQDVENQLHLLRDHAAQLGTLYKVFQDDESGKSSKRSGFKEMMLEAYQKRFDLVLFWKLDRFSREGTLATLEHLKKLDDYKVGFKSYSEPWLDTLGPFRDVVISLVATLAAQDLVKISENTKLALARKKAAGVKLGAPTKGQATIAEVLRLHGEGRSNGFIARKLKISPSTVAKYLPKPEPASASFSSTEIKLPQTLTKKALTLP
jgi:DNA invertase Pin-like site-specific DNA recombinase